MPSRNVNYWGEALRNFSSAANRSTYALADWAAAAYNFNTTLTGAASDDSAMSTERKGTNSMRIPNDLLVRYLRNQGFTGLEATLALNEVLATDTGRMRRLRAAYNRANEAWLEYANGLTFEQKFGSAYGYMRISRGSVKFVRSDFGDTVLPAVYGGRVRFGDVLPEFPEFPRWMRFVAEGRYVEFTYSDDASDIHRQVGGRYGYSFYSLAARVRNIEDAVGDAGDIRAMYVHIQNTFLPNYRNELRRAYREAAGTRVARQSELPRGQRNQKVLSAEEKQVRLEKYLNDIRKSKVKAISLDDFVIPEHGTLSSRNWGIEVESAGARGVQAPAGWNRKYDGSLSSAYDGYEEGDEPGDEPERPEGHIDLHLTELHLHRPHDWTGEGGAGACYDAPNPNYVPEDQCAECQEWQAERDEWSRRYDAYHYGGTTTSDDCAEFVSPILHSFHSKGLAKVLDGLEGQPQNDTAGIHVHVDASDLTAKQIGGLVYGYNVLEPLLEAAYQRETREYCKPRPLYEVFDIESRLNNGADPRTDYMGDRYVSLNIQSLAAHGTIEFRAMGPVYDYDYLVRWAYLCRELVNVAKNGATKKDYMAVHDMAGLKNLLIRFGKESVDNALSMISDEDIAAMSAKNNRMFDAQAVFASVGGEV